jgi:hypothetical protein
MGTRRYFSFGTVTYKTLVWKRQLFEEKFVPVLESRTYNSDLVFLFSLQMNAKILNANDASSVGDFSLFVWNDCV